MERSARFRTDLRVKKHRIVLNVSGQRFMAEKSSLKRHPHTLLGSDLLACFFDESKQEYFFDRDPYLFRYILNYYNCGKLHASPDDCPVAFKDELDYFGIPFHEMEECCWLTAYDKREKSHDHYAVRKTSIKAVHAAPARYIDWKRRGSSRGNVIKAPNTEEIMYNDSRISHLGPTSKNDKCAQRVRQKARFSGLETALREPPSHMDEINVDRNRDSSCCGCKPPGARVQNAFNLFYGLFIILSVAVTAIETVDCSEGIKCEAMYRTTFFVADSIFVGVFTLEFLIRFILSRNRCAFMKDLFNLVDLLAILPYYLSLIISYFMETSDVTVLITLRVLRVSRIMKLTRGSTRLQSLLYTLRNCSTDLVFLYFTFTLGILLFASALYYVEKDDNPANFTSIPHSLWYTCVTMMTTGYGDVVPLTTLGKIIGGLCCICGVVIMSLPIPIMQDKKVVVLG